MGVAIPSNQKSMRLAYGLGVSWASFLISMICLIFFLNTYYPNKQAVILSSLVVVVSLFLGLFLYFSKMTRHATYEEAMELCSFLNASARPVVERAVNERFNRLESIPVVNATVVGNNDYSSTGDVIQLA